MAEVHDANLPHQERSRAGSLDLPRESPLEILLVEDNPADARYIRELLRASSLTVDLTHATLLQEAVEHITRRNFDVIVLDMTLPDEDGLATVSRIRAVEPEIPIVVLTGHEDEEIGLKAVQCGAQDFLTK